jgi:hypothetical protein
MLRKGVKKVSAKVIGPKFRKKINVFAAKKLVFHAQYEKYYLSFSFLAFRHTKDLFAQRLNT